MLQTIRSNLQGTIAKVIIALMVVPFAVFGIDSFFNGAESTTVAVVNGEKIDEFELQRAITLQKRRLISMMGDQLPPSMLDDALLRKPALDSLIEQKLLLQAAEDAGLDASDPILNRTIASMEQFHEEGRFSQQRYEQLLRSQGFNSAFFKQLLGSEILLQQMRSGLALTAFATPQQVELAAKLGNEARNFNYATLSPANFSDSIEVSDEEVEAYYEANAKRFTSKPAVAFNYIELQEEDFYMPVDPVAVRAEYQRELTVLNQQARRKAAHILVEFGDDRSLEEARARIAAAQAALANGDNFAAVALQFSDDAGSAEQGGDLGIATAGMFPDAFESALAALKEGEVSAPVETEAGLHLIKLTELVKPKAPDFESRRAAIEMNLQRIAAKPLLVAKVEALRDLVFNAEDLSAPAKALSLTVEESGLMDAGSTEGLFGWPSVREAAFSDDVAKQGLNSEVIELSSDHFLVLKVTRFEPPAPLELAAVQGEIVDELTREKAAETAREAAAKVATRLRAGEDVQALAKEFGVDWQAGIRVKRSDNKVPGDIRQAVFSIAKGVEGDVTILEREAAGEQVVVKLLEVFPGDLSSMSAEERNGFAAGLARNTGSYSFAVLLEQLRGKSEIVIK